MLEAKVRLEELEPPFFLVIRSAILYRLSYRRESPIGGNVFAVKIAIEVNILARN